MPPRAALRQRNATPARSVRASSAIPTQTPGGRRSTRATSKQPTTIGDAVANPALPEVATVQSYAYGSSTAPTLPEQLYAPRNMNLQAVADRINDATRNAQRNFDTHAAEFRDDTPESQDGTRRVQAQGQGLQRQGLRLPPEETPEATRKQDRTANWVETSELDNLSEEEEDEQPVPRNGQSGFTSSRQLQENLASWEQREGSEPSSFPDGSFDHSYNYERGFRRPRRLTPPSSAMKRNLAATWASTLRLCSVCADKIRHTTRTICRALQEWFIRFVKTLRQSLVDLPDTLLVFVLIKTFAVLAAFGFVTYMFCTAYSFACAANSTSAIAQSLEKLCGQCRNPAIYQPITEWPVNLTSTGDLDVNRLIQTLTHINNEVQRLEKKLDSHISSPAWSITDDLEHLRSQQDQIQSQIDQLQKLTSNQQEGSYAGAFVSNGSPILSQPNFFALAAGAVVDPRLTSPTRSEEFSLPMRIMLSLVGIRRTLSHPPRAALEPWHDEGDCWCAAKKDQGAVSGNALNKTTILTVMTGELVYPTELVIEHFPASSSLRPGTAPRDIEVWADLYSMAESGDWERLHVDDLTNYSDHTTDETMDAQMFGSWLSKQTGSRWARVGRGEYQQQSAATTERRPRGDTHIQSFSMDWNQHGRVHYSQRFLIRVRSTWGEAFTCLYRVRLHGSVANQQIEETAELAR